jgi:DnaJ-class molecular chaperone
MRCHGCYGSGKMMGGGFMQKRCDACEGTGHIDHIAESAALANVLRETPPEVIVKKSRKRLVHAD